MNISKLIYKKRYELYDIVVERNNLINELSLSEPRDGINNEIFHLAKISNLNMDDTLKLFSSWRYNCYLTKFLKKPIFIEKNYLDFKNNNEIVFSITEQIKFQKEKLKN